MMKKSKLIPSIILFTMLAIVNIYSMKSVEFQGKYLFQLSIMPSYANPEGPCNDIKNCYDSYKHDRMETSNNSYARVCETPTEEICNMYYGYDFDEVSTCCND